MIKSRTWNVINRDATSLLESGCGGALIFRGIWMLYYDHSIPLSVQGLLIPAGIPEEKWGALLVAIGLIQLFEAKFEVSGLMRWIVAAIASVVIAIGWTAYFKADENYRAVVPLIIWLTISEMYLTWRGLSDWKMERLRRQRANGT